MLPASATLPPRFGSGALTLVLNGNGLDAEPPDVLTCTAPVVANPGTAATIRVASAEMSENGDTVPNCTADGPETARFSPTMVTIAPGLPPGGETKRMRGPFSEAMRVPVIEPEPPVPWLFHVPAAAPSETSSAVSNQLTCGQPGRFSVPVTANCAFGLVCIWPSMQSTSPSNVPRPVAELAPCTMRTSQLPLTMPSCGSVPCQAPDHTPERSGGGGCSSPPPPPPHAASTQSAAARHTPLICAMGPQ